MEYLLLFVLLIFLLIFHIFHLYSIFSTSIPYFSTSDGCVTIPYRREIPFLFDV